MAEDAKFCRENVEIPLDGTDNQTYCEVKDSFIMSEVSSTVQGEAMDIQKNEIPEIQEFKAPTISPLSVSSKSKVGEKAKKDNVIAEGNSKNSSDSNIEIVSESKETGNSSSSRDKHQISIPYQEPEWSGVADKSYTFDVLKNGIIIDSVLLDKKPFYVFGRLPSCDITLEHPSLSRHHAVVQYSVVSSPAKEKGWYIYDLDSTHGTWVNKKKIPPQTYQRLKVGHIVKFGGSSRLHILQGPDDDAEEEGEMTVTEMKEQREKLQKEAEILRQLEVQEEMRRRETEQKLLQDRGCGWGMGEDAEEAEEGENPFSSLVPENENLYIDDPKKALKGFYEREGCDLPDYQFFEAGPGKHKCRVDLPVDGPNGEELVAEVVVSGKRKDAVVACALEACRMLDKLGMLRSATHESRKRKQKKWEDNDFYDSDEDTFLDRTGTIEKKRFLRMKKAGKDEAETYESLLEKYNKVVEQITDTEGRLQTAKAEAESRAAEDMDELDAYMMSIKSGAMDTKTRMSLKGELLKLKAEEQRLRRLVNIAKPASLPPLKPVTSTSSTTPGATSVPVDESLARKLVAHQKKEHKKVTPVRTQAPVVDLKADDYEEEDEDEDTKESAEKEDRLSSTVSDDKDTSKTGPLGSLREPKGERSHTKNVVVPPTSQKASVKGASLPPSLAADPSVKKPVKPSHHMSTSATLNALGKASGKQGKSPSDPNFDSSDPEYTTWLPPTEQSGDGRTSLNDKLGY